MDVRILGPVELALGEGTVPIGGQKQRALLALLALNRGVAVSSDRLIEELWEGQPPPTARNAVQGYVSQLRKAVGARLETQGSSYVLRLEPGELDLDRFEARLAEGRELLAAGDAEAAANVLREGLALWRGRPLEGLDRDTLVHSEAERLEERRLACLEERIDADLALGRQADAIPELERLVRAHPLRERFRAQLMLALYRAGRQAEALQVYQEARRTLVDGLGCWATRSSAPSRPGSTATVGRCSTTSAASARTVPVEPTTSAESARPRRREGSRCGLCGRRCPGYDQGEGRRRWRALDLGATKAFVEAEAPRVECGKHGVVVARVPWARHGSWFTREFEQQLAWLATQCSKSAVCELMRVSWLTVRIVERVVADESSKRGDPFRGLQRIGIDELSYRVGQRYITVVVCHDSGRLVSAAPGRDKKTVERFFAELGDERKARIELVSSDMGEWVTRVVAKRCPQATLCLDPYHVVALATAALDEVRREVWNEARRAGDKAGARFLKGARFCLWKRPERLSDRQQAKLSQIAKINERLYRAYLLKEQLRLVFQAAPEEALALLEAWLAWARRCRLPSFVKLAKTIAAHQAGIAATLTHRLSNARTEAINTTLRLICRRAYGFHSAEALIALAMLTVGGLRPALPGR